MSTPELPLAAEAAHSLLRGVGPIWTSFLLFNPSILFCTSVLHITPQFLVWVATSKPSISVHYYIDCKWSEYLSPTWFMEGNCRKPASLAGCGELKYAPDETFEVEQILIVAV